MADGLEHEEKMIILAEVARLLGVPTRWGVDTFGRRSLHVPVAGLQLMHEHAMDMGQAEVAGDIRQMLAQAPRFRGPR